MTAAQSRVPAQPVPDSDPQLRRGIELLRAGKWDEAEFTLTAAHANNPTNFDALHFLAALRQKQGREREALDLVKRALKLRPRSPESLALQDDLLSHLGGESEEVEDYPCWNGEYLAGTLLVSAAPSVGDQIRYASLVPQLVTRAAAIVLQVDPRLVDLFARSFPAADVAPMRTMPAAQVAAYVPMASLADYLRADQSTFLRSDKRLLTPNPMRAAAFREQFAGDRCVVIGVSWNNQENARCIDSGQARLRDFASVLGLPNSRFVDLQGGDTRAERDRVEREFGIRVEHCDGLDPAHDIDGLAALMTACDIVVTASNTIADLAGALGRPTWNFLSCGPVRPWRWSDESTVTPRHPHVRVKRQASGQSWADLIAASADEIW
jgi:hypothetical protein